MCPATTSQVGFGLAPRRSPRAIWQMNLFAARERPGIPQLLSAGERRATSRGGVVAQQTVPVSSHTAKNDCATVGTYAAAKQERWLAGLLATDHDIDAEMIKACPLPDFLALTRRYRRCNEPPVLPFIYTRRRVEGVQ
jgi:hypothetical protein